MGKIWRISGPVVIAEGMRGSQVYEVVHIGEEELIGEVIGLDGDRATIQAHEDTLGLRVGERIEGTGKILTAELGPGIMASIYDGLQKSLTSLMSGGELFLKRGAKAFALPRDKKWHFTPRVKVGDTLDEGHIIGVVPETELVEHRIMVPPGTRGTLKRIVGEGEYTIEEPIAWVEQDGVQKELTLKQEWPVRKPRPYKNRFDPSGLLVTGMRIMDYMFPLALGGKACVPGGFGTGKTVALQQLVRWAQTDINIYVGCGERGNEMADVLHSFTRLREPKTGRLLMEKEVFIANTSNMPVIAREVSVFIGITLAEYFRDMGYDILVVADSTSRWAEAMRELGGRLEEMPGEEGFPPYLGSRLASFYERAGMVECLGSPQRKGSITVVGAVSPPGADFSEPVTQNTLRIVEALYSLDVALANRRHFPTINWLTSYSLYAESTREWWSEIAPDWADIRASALKVLQQEAQLEEIVRLVGPEALPENDKLLLLNARMIREDFLAQSAYHEIDTYCLPKRAHLMLRTIMKFYELAGAMVNSGIPVSEIRSSPMVHRISRMKDIPSEEFEDRIAELWTEMDASLVGG
ncbi:V-type ATP synthase subunit A [Dehalococcoidia bacterium]|nr:V-type ATP synthase subunit A [Dehalococcoidia bacterium]MCL0104258.1 V-type ATP synthase subunit A [Dehalococcoidia bacterium]